MKQSKILLLVVVFCAIFSNCLASDVAEVVNSKHIITAQNKIDEIGFRILNSNYIQKRTVFDLDIKRYKNANSNLKNRQITVYRTLFERMQTDDEIAFVLAHEIAHSVESYDGIFRGFFHFLSYAFAPRKYEYKADKHALDYMVKAGYNPLASIVVLSKISPQTRYEWCHNHPLTTKRMMALYEYIYQKYPEYLVNNKYKDNMFYQNFLLNSIEARKKFQNKVITNRGGL
ncbi:M48 family metalloprotease [bacterium]|nr:M48 family metalloprotease [bacterium]